MPFEESAERPDAFQQIVSPLLIVTEFPVVNELQVEPSSNEYSMVFVVNENELLLLLLSNVRYWVE